MTTQSVVDDFWTHDIVLFDGTFRYYRTEPRPVRAKIHVSQEQYAEKYREIVPISTHKGTRSYVLMQPYVPQPNIILTVGLYHTPKHYADQAAAIGETVAARQEGIQAVKIGNGQAWYYPEDKTLILWECFFESFVRDAPLLHDPNMKQLWRKFEAWLIQQFPDTRMIATPFSDPLFPIQDYQDFLRHQGYEPGAQGAFVKLVQ